MKVYRVIYKDASYSGDKEIFVVAANAVKAAQEVSKTKYSRYSGYVSSVVQYLSFAVIAK